MFLVIFAIRLFILYLVPGVCLAAIEMVSPLGAITEGVTANLSIYGALLAAYGLIIGLKMAEKHVKAAGEGYETSKQWPVFRDACEEEGIDPEMFDGNDWQGLEDWKDRREHPFLGNLEGDPESDEWWESDYDRREFYGIEDNDFDPDRMD